jgi:DNA-binding response OmpR family regulator
MECFLASGGEAVSRETLLERLGRDQKLQGSDGLNAAIHRLRKRIERAAPTQGPLQARPRFGYVFKAPLQVI